MKIGQVRVRASGQMGWPAFHQAYPRSYMLFADLVEGASQQRGFVVLHRMIAQAGLLGRYAMMPEPGLYRVAFEKESDALKVAEALSAARTGRETRWAGQWAVAFTAVMQADIIKVLTPAPKRGLSFGVKRKSQGSPTQR
jgi:hypothetical protein